MSTIHAIPVGGGILTTSSLPGRNGVYEADIEHLRDLQPSYAISLTTLAEMVAAGAEHIGADFQESGTRWEHLPILDYSVPDEAFMREWPRVSQTARQALTGKGRVVVHCKGGCGRSGMVALRLMIESGIAPDDALAQLRAIHPQAVETDEQMEWAMSAPRAPAQFVRHED